MYNNFIHSAKISEDLSVANYAGGDECAILFPSNKVRKNMNKQCFSFFYPITKLSKMTLIPYTEM